MTSRLAGAYFIAAWCLSAQAGQAADLPVPANAAEVVVPSRWEFAIAPYVWAAGISGNIAQFGLPDEHIDASFSDIFRYIEFGGMVVTETRYDRFGLFTDLVYVKLGGSKGTPEHDLADGVSVDTKTLAFTAAPEYRLLDRPRGSLDAIAGLRVWSVDTTANFDGGLLEGVGGSDSATWVDPLIGLKGRFNLTSSFYLSAWAMVGGFDVSSHFMWDVWGGAGYEFNKHVSAVLGYRGMGVNYDNDDGFLFDVVEHGPVLGAVFKF